MGNVIKNSKTYGFIVFFLIDLNVWTSWNRE